jgi:hypothetical protein
MPKENDGSIRKEPQTPIKKNINKIFWTNIEIEKDQSNYDDPDDDIVKPEKIESNPFGDDED